MSFVYSILFICLGVCLFQLTSAQTSSPPVSISSGATSAKLLTQSDVLNGIVGGALLYSVSTGGVVRSLQNGGDFALDTPTDALDHPLAYIKLIPTTACSATQPFCSTSSTMTAPLSQQPLAIQTALVCGNGASADLNIWGGIQNTFAGTSVMPSCQGGVENNEVFQFVNWDSSNTMFSIQAWSTVNGLQCVQAVSSCLGSVHLSLTNCSSTAASQRWVLYGLQLPPTVLLQNVLETYNPVTYYPVLLYSVGRSTALLGLPPPNINGGGLFNLLPLNAALANRWALTVLGQMYCVTTTSGDVCSKTVPGGGASLVYVYTSLSNKNCVGNSQSGQLWNVWGGWNAAVVGNPVMGFCEFSVSNNEAFIFLPVTVAGATVYQIQAWNTQNGQLCVTVPGYGAAFEQFSFTLQTCDVSNQYQQFALVSDS